MTLRFSLSAVLSTCLLSACATVSNNKALTTPSPVIVQQTSSITEQHPTTAHTGSAALIGERMLSGGILEFGAPDAPLTLLTVLNYSSSYSRSFLTEQLPRLMEDFLRSGELSVRFLPLQMQKYTKSDAQAASLLCAAAQHKGMTMNEWLSTNDGVPLVTDKTQMTALGLDAKVFKACLISPATLSLVEEEKNQAKSLGVTLAPSFVLNDESFQGLPDYPDLRGRIREKMLTTR